MNYNIKPMDRQSIEEILNWRYNKPYSIYNMECNDETIQEMSNGLYYVVRDKENDIIGYYCFCESAQVPVGNKYGVYDNEEYIDIGLGLKPRLCGKGKGFNFLNELLRFARENFQLSRFRLTVAVFNKRAINLYTKLGFRKIKSFVREDSNGIVEFVVMEKNEED